MSKRDVTVLCTLAAHLQRACVSWQSEDFDPDYTPAQCAADAMTLQRLGRRTRNLFKKLDTVWAYRLELGVQEKGRIEEAGNAVLRPYGLSCHVSGEYLGFYIKGLPANTESAIEEFTL